MTRAWLRCILIPGLGLAAVLAASSVLAQQRTSKRLAADRLIKPVLARRVGDAVCFSGTFEGLNVNVWDYAKAKGVPVPGVFRFGEQVMRPEPYVYVDQKLTAMTLLLNRDEREHDHWDEMHEFRLNIALEGWPTRLRAAGECPLRLTNRPIEGSRDSSSVNTTKLFCGIDCDGGHMEVERVEGTGDVIFRFDPMSGGLRMSSGCSGGQPYHVGGDAKPYDEDLRKARKPVSFRLTAMTAEACAAVRKEISGGARE